MTRPEFSQLRVQARPHAVARKLFALGAVLVTHMLALACSGDSTSDQEVAAGGTLSADRGGAANAGAPMDPDDASGGNPSGGSANGGAAEDDMSQAGSGGASEMNPPAGGVAGEGGTPVDSGGGGDSGGDSGGDGGAAGENGGADSGGASAGGASSGSDDCNAISDQPNISVAKQGADFDTLQAALDSLSSSNTTPTIIRIAPGSYREKLRIDVPQITLCGQLGREQDTVLTFTDGADTPNGNGGTLGTTGSASVTLSSDDVSVENLTFENTRGVGTQAVALLVNGERVQFRNVRFLANQDTLYVKNGSQYFRDCYVEGTVDFIFGGATAVFEDCHIHNVGTGTAVVAPNTDQATEFGLVFLGGQLTADGSIADGSMALGRNWGAYGAAAFLHSELGRHISGVGWVKMSDNVLATARFSEFETMGPGANPGARAPESRQLSADEAAVYTADQLFEDWVPSFSR